MQNAAIENFKNHWSGIRFDGRITLQLSHGCWRNRGVLSSLAAHKHGNNNLLHNPEVTFISSVCQRQDRTYKLKTMFFVFCSIDVRESNLVVEALIARYFSNFDGQLRNLRYYLHKICNGAIFFDIKNLTPEVLKVFEKRFVSYCSHLANLSLPFDPRIIPEIKISTSPPKNITRRFDVCPENGCREFYRRCFRRRKQ